MGRKVKCPEKRPNQTQNVFLDRPDNTSTNFLNLELASKLTLRLTFDDEFIKRSEVGAITGVTIFRRRSSELTSLRVY